MINIRVHLKILGLTESKTGLIIFPPSREGQEDPIILEWGRINGSQASPKECQIPSWKRNLYIKFLQIWYTENWVIFSCYIPWLQTAISVWRCTSQCTYLLLCLGNGERSYFFAFAHNSLPSTCNVSTLNLAFFLKPIKFPLIFF